MAGKVTDRKGKKTTEGMPSVTNFSLPTSLPCSELDFPVLVKKKAVANWNSILEESDKKFTEIEEYESSLKETPVTSPFRYTECEYIKNEILVQLAPALDELLQKAQIWNAFERPNCFFNGVDHLVQTLWNNNPRCPIRKYENLHVFNMPWVRKYLEENPRPYYPKSWLWPEEHAATLIQKTFRQYLVQREEDVQEMRTFWRKLKYERSHPDLKSNPYLSRVFASCKDLASSKSKSRTKI